MTTGLPDGRPGAVPPPREVEAVLPDVLAELLWSGSPFSDHDVRP